MPINTTSRHFKNSSSLDNVFSLWLRRLRRQHVATARSSRIQSSLNSIWQMIGYHSSTNENLIK